MSVFTSISPSTSHRLLWCFFAGRRPSLSPPNYTKIRAQADTPRMISGEGHVYLAHYSSNSDYLLFCIITTIPRPKLPGPLKRFAECSQYYIWNNVKLTVEKVSRSPIPSPLFYISIEYGRATKTLGWCIG